MQHYRQSGMDSKNAQPSIQIIKIQLNVPMGALRRKIYQSYAGAQII